MLMNDNGFVVDDLNMFAGSGYRDGETQKNWVLKPWLECQFCTPEMIDTADGKTIVVSDDRVIFHVENGMAVYERLGLAASHGYVKLKLVESTWRRPPPAQER